VEIVQNASKNSEDLTSPPQFDLADLYKLTQPKMLHYQHHLWHSKATVEFSMATQSAMYIDRRVENPISRLGLSLILLH
jgi:hypothetical protein